MKKLARAGAAITGVIILVTAAVIAVALLDKPLIKKTAQRYLTNKTGIALTIGRLDYHLFPLSVEASAVKASYATPAYSIEVAAGRIGLKGDLMKLIRGEMPALETADAEITEIRVNQAKASAEPVDFQSVFLQISRMLNASRRMSLRCGRLVVLLLSQDFRLDNSALSVTGGRAEGTYDATLSCDNIAGVTNGGRLSFGSRLDAAGELSLGRTAGLNLRLAVVKPRIDAAGKSAEAASLTAEIQGAWQPDKGALRFPRLVLDIPGLASFTGTLDIIRGGNPSFAAEGKATIFNLEALARAAGPFLPDAFRSVRLRGNAGLEGQYSLGPGPAGKKENLAVHMKTGGVEWEYRLGGLPFRGSLSGTLGAEGTLADPQVSGDLRFESGKLSAMGAVARSAAGHLKFAGSKTHAEISVPAAVLRDVSVAVAGGKSAAFERIGLSGSIGVRISGQPSVVTRMEMRLSGLAPVRLAGRLGMAPWRVYEASLESSGQEVPALRKLLNPFLPQTLSGWAADGEADIRLEAEGLGSAKWPTRVRADVTLSGGKFNDPAFVIASDGLRSRISVLGNYGTGKGEFAITGSIELLKGESLWRRFYVSWDKFPLRAEISGRLDPAAWSLNDLSAKVFARGLGEFQANGHVGLASPSIFDLRANTRFALEPALSMFSAPNPAPLGRPRVRGDAATDFEIGKTSAGLTLKGRLKLRDVSVTNSSSGFSVPSLSCDLPFDLALAGIPAAPAGAAGETGELRIGRIRDSRFELDIPPLLLTGSSNAWEIAPFAIEVLGGRLEFGKTSLAVATRPLSFRGESSLRLTETDLSKLPLARAGASIKGTLRADFPALGITSGEVRASGRTEADIFGGRVTVTNLAVLDPFASDREISCDIDLLDLDLKKITDLVPFGEVTGIIRGEIRNLVITYGQPEQFTLTLESVERKGVPRTFSLKAVNSLTVITAGQSATPGTSSFWLRFIKGFRYDKIGIRSTLKNDTFTIDGTIRENGVEYLVKRPPLFGISVINRNPGKTISFKDMMSRLNRVGQSGAPDTK